MALKKCRECGSRVSTRAATCPSCGAPVKRKSKGCGCLIVLAILAFGVICIGIFSNPSDSPRPAVNPEPALTPEQQSQKDAEDKAAQEKREAELAAEREAAQKRQKQNLDRFMKRLSSAGIDNSIIDSVSVKGDSATITVANAWHSTAYQIRLQAAQNLWKLWASIASPTEPDKARIKLVDLNDNEVGGSRILAGSLLWVQEN